MRWCNAQTARGQIRGQLFECGARLFGKIPGIKAICRRIYDEQIVIVDLQLVQNVAKMIQLLGTHGVKIQAVEDHKLAIGHHGKGREGIQKPLRGVFQRVNAKLVEYGKGGIGANGVSGLLDGKGLEIILVTKKEIARAWCAFQLLAKVRVL